MANPFDIGREMVSPHNSGKMFGEIPVEELLKLTTALTEREKAHPHAKYYYEPMGAIQPEHEAALRSGPMAPEDCYMPEEVARHVNNTGHDKVENGYGVMKNGVGFAAIKIDQVGITDEMIRYFRENFAHYDDLYYKVWFPGAHLLHYVNGAVEDFGWDMLNMHMTFTADLSTLGFQDDKILENDPKCINSMVASGLSVPLYHPEKGEQIASMFSYTRDLGDNHRELRVRYWVGLAFDDFGQPFVRGIEDRELTMKKAKLMMEHCMREYSNQNRLIKEFWAARR